MVVFLNSGISAVLVSNTKYVQHKVYVYLTITNQNKFFTMSSIAG